MSYNKTDWYTNDLIIAEKLNNIEDGIANNTSSIISIDSIIGNGAESLSSGTTLKTYIDAQHEDALDHIPAVDTTLSIENATAEAKTVGDQLSIINNKFDTIDLILGTTSAPPTPSENFHNRLDYIEDALNDTGWPEYVDYLEEFVDNLINVIYPIGYIYISMSNVNPMTLFPGTYWLQIKDQFLLSVGDIYTSGGETGGEIEHQLIKSELPNVNGNVVMHGAGSYGTCVNSISGTDLTGSAYFNGKFNYGTVNNYSQSWGVISFNIGANQPHNNMPPYLTVYMWRRVTQEEYEESITPSEPDTSGEEVLTSGE